MKNIFNSVGQLVGNTPLLELSNIEKQLDLKAKIFAKLEFFNPAGSAKDRVALEMINDAEEKGLINNNSVLIEPTSGNTGIGLASIGVSRGYKVIIVMPDTMSKERILLMKAYGAQVVLSDGSLGMTGAVKKAEEIAQNTPNSFIVGQFTNPANPSAHRKATGPEIFKDTDGEIDFFVAGIGTGGTITGVGEYLKGKNSKIKIVGVEPSDSPLLTEGRAGSHKIQGIGANFIPKILNTEIIDEIITARTDNSFETSKLVGRSEGILIGISSGAALYAAIQIAKRPENSGKNIVVLLPDSGDRYLSSGLFE